jgi:CTP:molybdopterin cytidylyltransferase MocA
VRLGRETLLERAVRTAGLASLHPIFVVIAPGRSPSLDAGIVLLVNEAAAEGMASSIRAGIAAAISTEASGAIVLACDQPAVTPEHLRALATGGGQVIASSYARRKGAPAYFPRSMFAGLMKLSGDIGAREILRHARAIELKQGELDIDTSEDLKRARELYASDPPLRRSES